MFPFANALSAGLLAAAYIGGGAGTNDASGNYAISAGTLAGMNAAAGDMIIVDTYAPSTGQSLTTTGWTTTGKINFAGGQNDSTYIMWRALTASDISSGLTISGMAGTAGNQGVQWGVYRGVATVTLVSQVASTGATGTTIDIPGFTPNARACGIVAISSNRNNSPSRSPPTGFAGRVGNNPVNSGAFGSQGRADLLFVATYVANATVSFTNEGDATHEKDGFLLELRT